MGADDGDVPGLEALIVDIVDDADAAAGERLDDLGVVDDGSHGEDALAGIVLPYLEGQVDGASDPETEACVFCNGYLHAAPPVCAQMRYS